MCLLGSTVIILSYAQYSGYFSQRKQSPVRLPAALDNRKGCTKYMPISLSFLCAVSVLAEFLRS